MSSDRAISGVMLAAALLVPGCKGNINNDSVSIPFTRRLSTDSAGHEGNSFSGRAAIAPDGSFVVFSSFASNLVRNDANGFLDVFLKNIATGEVFLISREDPAVPDGNPDDFGGADSASFDAVLSATGRFIAFVSYATDLIGGLASPPDGSVSNVFVFDRLTLKTHLVSTSDLGALPDFDCRDASISADGRHIAFASKATTLIDSESELNDVPDIFLATLDYDAAGNVVSKTMVRLSRRIGAATEADGESIAPSISANGRIVAFESSATNLLALAEPQDTNLERDIYVYDQDADGNSAFGDGRISRVSVRTDEGEATGPPGPSGLMCRGASVSGNGRFVVFSSSAANLLDNDLNFVEDIFIHDRDANGNGVFYESLPGFDETRTARISVSSTEIEAQGGDSTEASISTNGQYVVFTSSAVNLVSGDTNANFDIFLRDLGAGTTIRVSVGTFGTQTDSSSGLGRASANAQFVVFESNASNIVDADLNFVPDIFYRGPLF